MNFYYIIIQSVLNVSVKLREDDVNCAAKSSNNIILCFCAVFGVTSEQHFCRVTAGLSKPA